ncbi:myrosinase-binding protein 1-like [Punica granatum]|uniref:Myrosinase-binding protein 1-like n=1 Tax=Punica granatum TaxID=22663 RepID=A0A6P8C4W5_PUNGR|nr:myrosinase-binding protein 1-like [Punica granatum]
MFVTYGPFGTEEGDHFSFPENGGRKVGFHGRASNHLKSIGAYFEPSSMPSAACMMAMETTYEEQATVELAELHVRVTEGCMDPLELRKGCPQTWDDGRFSHVSQIDVVVESTIRSIRFDYEKKESFIRSQFHGATDAYGKTKTIKFDSPEEYLIAISGYTGDDSGSNCIQSLKYQIGAHFEPVSHLYPVQSIGPFEAQAQGSSSWSDGIFTGVSRIKTLFKRGIIRILVEYDWNDDSVWSSIYDESYWGRTATLLTFQSNKGRYGPYGMEKGSYFFFPPTNGKIVGFFGSFGSCLNSIEVYTLPIPHQYPFKSIGPYGGQGGSPWDDGVFTDVRLINILCGFIVDTDLRQMKILSGSVIVSIGIEYDNNGSPVPGSQHGVDRVYMGLNAEDKEIEPPRAAKRVLADGFEHDSMLVYLLQVKLDYPKEYLVSVSGFTGKKLSEEAVQSLTIKTNKKTYGPYGTREGYHFELPPSGGRTVGFFGRAGRFLNSIGARL